MVKTIRFPIILQKCWQSGEHIKIGINPSFINNFKNNNESVFIPTKCIIKPEETLLHKDEVVVSLYNTGLQNEYLFYTPVRGKIINHNKTLINNLSTMFTNNVYDNWLLEIKPIENICGKYHWWY
tara:strand:- start:24 stop:398 length:375 start_codon:yes stop_codon:yes gene_type:complete